MIIKRLGFEKLKNTRDLGGFEAAGGRKIKKGKLIRSGALAGASVNDLNLLVNGYKIRTVIDLRTEMEIFHAPDPVIEGVDCVSLPLLDNSFFGIARDEYSIEAWLNLFRKNEKEPAEIFSEMYLKLTFDDYVKEYVREFFTILANAENAVLWHCSAGKDRVGVTTALLLYALGVPKELILRDYLMTEVFTFPEIAKTVLLGSLKYHSKRMSDSIRVLMGVRPEYLLNIFRKAEEEFDGMYDFFEKQYGIDRELIGKLRDNYLE